MLARLRRRFEYSLPTRLATERLTVRSLAALALALSLLLLATPAPATADEVVAPTVGSCHDLDRTEGLAESDPKAPVDCTDDHTTVTVAVVELRGDIDWSDAAGLRKQYLRPCYRGLLGALHASPTQAAISAYVFLSFLPTTEERASGARWVRCDAAAPTPKGWHELRPGSDLTLSKRAYLPGEDAYCLAGPRLRRTTCDHGHLYRAYQAYELDSFPKNRRTRLQAAQQCDRRGRYSLFSAPTRQEWNFGHHVLTCFGKSR